MSGWVPMPADGWAETAELLTSTGKPWPRQAVIADLRWFEDQGRSIPGRPTLRDRWHWTDWAVRSMLADEASWKDPLRASPPASLQRPPAVRQPTPAPERMDADNSDDFASVPPAAASEPPADLHTRGVPPSPPPSPPPEDQTDVAPSRPPEPDRYLEAAAYFGEVVHRAIGRRPSHGPDRKTKLGQKLLREVKRDPERVLDAMRLVGEGRGERAQFLRAYDGFSLATVLARIDEYAELWRAEQEPGWRPRGPPTRRRPSTFASPPDPGPFDPRSEPDPF